MARANPDACPHPVRKRRTPSFGHTECKRCGADITPADRSFEHRHGERTTLKQGDRVHVRGGPHGPSFKGVFQWAEPCHSGLAYCIAEKQMWKPDDKSPWREDTAAIRTIRSEYVRHDDGVRQRKAREEATA